MKTAHRVAGHRGDVDGAALADKIGRCVKLQHGANLHFAAGAGVADLDGQPPQERMQEAVIGRAFCEEGEGE
ncbi:MAG: hypothetical protein PSX37_13475 [bacterium]|nr:hypothetical protein [bacterium]